MQTHDMGVNSGILVVWGGGGGGVPFVSPFPIKFKEYVWLFFVCLQEICHL